MIYIYIYILFFVIVIVVVRYSVRDDLIKKGQQIFPIFGQAVDWNYNNKNN